MKILVVSSFLPYPLFSGGHVRLFNILKLLSERHEIFLICEKRIHQTQNDIVEVEKFCKKVITIERKKQWSSLNILKTIVTPYPFLMVGHQSKKMKEEIGRVLKEQEIDLIHVETFYVMHNLPKEPAVPVVLVEHNIEYLVYSRYAGGLPFPLRYLFNIDILKLRYWEEKFWSQAKELVAVSDQEKKLMKRADAHLVPNGVDTSLFKMPQSKSSKEKRLLFIGDFHWIQNRDAVFFLITKVWPLIRKSLEKEEAKLWIVGREIPEDIKRLVNDKGVIFDERAFDTQEVFQRTTLLLAPIRVGGGTSFKILEAMASGVPVLTTTLGIEGIEAKDGEEVVIVNTEKEFVSQTVRLLKDRKLYDSLSRKGRKLIQDKYSWDKIVAKLEKVYEKALNEREK